MKRRIGAGVVIVAAFAAASVLAPAPFADARETLRERLRDRMAERMGADEGPKAANTSRRVAHNRYVKPPPFECPVAYTRRSSIGCRARRSESTVSKKARSRSP